MTDNEKLCKFQGWQTTKDGKHLISIARDYLNDDAAAMSLLDTLVEKGYSHKLVFENRLWFCDIGSNITYGKPTRRAAVCATVLEIIEKENV